MKKANLRNALQSGLVGLVLTTPQMTHASADQSEIDGTEYKDAATYTPNPGAFFVGAVDSNDSSYNPTNETADGFVTEYKPNGSTNAFTGFGRNDIVGITDLVGPVSLGLAEDGSLININVPLKSVSSSTESFDPTIAGGTQFVDISSLTGTPGPLTGGYLLADDASNFIYANTSGEAYANQFVILGKTLTALEGTVVSTSLQNANTLVNASVQNNDDPQNLQFIGIGYFYDDITGAMSQVEFGPDKEELFLGKIPEPSVYALGTGLAALGAAAYSRRRKK